MTQEYKLFKMICERCENYSSMDVCDCMEDCAAYKLYKLALENREIKIWKDWWYSTDE